ncbi:MAG: 4-hydroxybenzoate octaprenyltransferase [Lachnospirales bacterium]
MALTNFLKEIEKYGKLVMFSHTIFSLSFGLVTMLMATNGELPLKTMIFTLLALLCARTGANAINRVIDAEFDKENPRTTTRQIPQGEVSKKETIIFSVINFMLLVLFSFLINPLCGFLSPIALFFLITYSYTKRYTFLCHLYLGFTCAIATMGSYLAIKGGFYNLYPFTLFIGNMLWVAGFDIIYGSQDYEFDKSIGLHSMATQFGVEGALNISTFFHIVAIIFLYITGFLYTNFGAIYFTIVTLISLLLMYEHIIVSKTNFKHIKIASYGINQIVALIFLFSIIDIYL